MFLDISHQEFDRQDWYHEGYQYAYDQDEQLCGAESKSEFHKLQKACTKHNRNCQEEGELGRNRTGGSGKDSSDNGRSGTGRSRNYGENLETANNQCGFECELIQSGTGWSAAFIVILNNNKKYFIFIYL